jgi:uncharacterized protein (DUF58 family)
VSAAARTTLLGLAMVLVGGLFDGEPFYAAGLGFVALGAGSAGWVAWTARSTRVQRALALTTVTEDESLEAEIRVDAGGRPLPGGWVEDGLLAEPVRLGPGRIGVRFRLEASFPRRGRRTLPPPRVVLRDPLGLARRDVVGTEPDEILVLPRTHPVRAPRGAGASFGGLGRSALAVAAEVEVDGLRPYQTGSPASRIHWPALARGHDMMERRLRTDLDARPLVVLDTAGAAPAEAVDEAVRAAASLALHLGRAGGCALLLPGERRATVIDPDLGAWPAAHVRLALTEAGRGPSAAALAPRSGPVLYVCPRVPRELPRSLRAAVGPRLLVVPGELSDRTAAFRVGACRGYVMGREARARARVRA